VRSAVYALPPLWSFTSLQTFDGLGERRALSILTQCQNAGANDWTRMSRPVRERSRKRSERGGMTKARDGVVKEAAQIVPRCVEAVVLNDERKDLLLSIKSSFANLGSSLNWENAKCYSAVSVDAGLGSRSTADLNLFRAACG
jgi:hypothetical protein